MIGKLCSFGGFLLILFCMFSVLGGLIVLIGFVDFHGKRISEQLDRIYEKMEVIPVDYK